MRDFSFKRFYKKIEILSENMAKDHISESAAQCSYYTILSFIPFIILLITLIQYTGIEPQTLFDIISKVVPSSMSDMDSWNSAGGLFKIFRNYINFNNFTIWAAGKRLICFDEWITDSV